MKRINDDYCVVVQAFLGTQDDAITDEEAAAKYNEYKLEFRRQQLNEFFVSHRLVESKYIGTVQVDAVRVKVPD